MKKLVILVQKDIPILRHISETIEDYIYDAAKSAEKTIIETNSTYILKLAERWHASAKVRLCDDFTAAVNYYFTQGTAEGDDIMVLSNSERDEEEYKNGHPRLKKYHHIEPTANFGGGPHPTALRCYTVKGKKENPYLRYFKK